jgi:ABC-type transport system involved in cytochrome bd biosynthesis fused ATPase/permease subunit
LEVREGRFRVEVFVRVLELRDVRAMAPGEAAALVAALVVVVLAFFAALAPFALALFALALFAFALLALPMFDALSACVGL